MLCRKLRNEKQLNLFVVELNYRIKLLRMECMEIFRGVLHLEVLLYYSNSNVQFLLSNFEDVLYFWFQTIPVITKPPFKDTLSSINFVDFFVRSSPTRLSFLKNRFNKYIFTL